MSVENNYISIYNAEKQELIGVFDSYLLAAFFIYGKEYKAYKTMIAIMHNSVRRKCTIIRNNIGFRCAARKSTKQQIELLTNDARFIILDKTLEHRITFNLLMGFTSTRETLYKANKTTKMHPNQKVGIANYLKLRSENIQSSKQIKNIIQ